MFFVEWEGRLVDSWLRRCGARTSGADGWPRPPVDGLDACPRLVMHVADTLAPCGLIFAVINTDHTKCEQLAKMFDVSGEPQIRNASNRQKRTCRDIFGEMHGKESTRLLEPRATERGRGPSVQQGMFVSECLNSALICCVRVVSCPP
jgi:hypothetical protein